MGAALLLAGCAPALSPPESSAVKISGIAAVYADGMAARRARLTWARSGGRDIVEIKTPLGTTQAQIIIDGGVAALYSGGREVPLAEAGTEIQKWLLLLPPPQSFGYWLLGESDPQYSSREVFVPGAAEISRINQHGWEIIYAGRGEENRPARIELRAAAPDSPGAAQNARAEIQISKWLQIP